MFLVSIDTNFCLS